MSRCEGRNIVAANVASLENMRRLTVGLSVIHDAKKFERLGVKVRNASLGQILVLARTTHHGEEITSAGFNDFLWDDGEFGLSRVLSLLELEVET